MFLCLMLGCAASDVFTPLLQAPEEQAEELSKVQKPEEVKTEVNPEINKTVTRAATAQDAVNSVMQRFYADGGEGCESVALPDGSLGLVAVGTGTYGSEMSNIVAQRREQQIAYYVAFLQAKRLMARYFEGASMSQLQAFFVTEGSSDEGDSGVS